MKYCDRCKNEINANDSSCGVCGNPLIKKDKKKTYSILFLICIILFIIIISGAIVFSSKGSNPNTNPSSSVEPNVDVPSTQKPNIGPNQQEPNIGPNQQEPNIGPNQQEPVPACNFNAQQDSEPRFAWVEYANKIYNINLNEKCDKMNVSITNSINLEFVKNNIEHENISMKNYELNIYINDILIDTNMFKFSLTNDINDFIDTNSFSVYEFNNLYFFTNYMASQCGGANTLVTDINGNILKTFKDFKYTFHNNSTFSIYDYGNCMDNYDDKETLYKIENNTIIELN